MRVVAYLRVSTSDQAEHGHGLGVQRAAVGSWARANGHRIVEVFSDEGVSGSNGLDSRVGLADALELVCRRRAEGIVVYRLDRLARDLVVQETLYAEIQRIGGALFSTSAAEAGYLVDDPDDPARRLIRQVLGAVAEYERSMIMLRLRSGRRRKAEQGGYAFGAPPFGMRAAAKGLVPDEGEQQVIERVIRMRDAGASIRSIAADLNADGVPPKRGQAGAWHPTTVARLLRRLDGSISGSAP